MRRITTQLGLCDPGYPLFQGIRSFIRRHLHVDNQNFGVVVDYGAGETPYREFFHCNDYKACDVAQNSQGTISHLISDTQTTDLPAEVADLVLCMDVLEHTANPERALKEIRRVAKKGASILISLPFLYREHEAPHDYYRFTTFCLERMMRENGFEIKSKEKIGGYCYTAFSIWYEGPVKHPEREVFTFFERLLRSLFRRTLLPLLNLTIFKTEPRADDTAFNHILLLCRTNPNFAESL